ncbi:hypothetical protein EVAR_40925_1 [Eumeta japonica]|uniref:Uncharacterized protein n=1 Tax=Eumeta variegata TaxID=151549 RepID=A0A4C1X3P1_EUMVA|nr:hypothetical protein EVAR_40925_1 [Eumeta japonica]
MKAEKSARVRRPFASARAHAANRYPFEDQSEYFVLSESKPFANRRARAAGKELYSSDTFYVQRIKICKDIERRRRVRAARVFEETDLGRNRPRSSKASSFLMGSEHSLPSARRRREADKIVTVCNNQLNECDNARTPFQ